MVGEEGLWKAKEREKSGQKKKAKQKTLAAVGREEAVPSIFSLHFPSSPKSIVTCSFLLFSLPWILVTQTLLLQCYIYLMGIVCCTHQDKDPIQTYHDTKAKEGTAYCQRWQI